MFHTLAFILATLLISVSAAEPPEPFNVIFPQSFVINDSGNQESSITAGGSVTDSSGNTFVVGNFTGKATFGAQVLNSSGGYGFPDVYLAKYNTAGEVVWAVRAGGQGKDFGRAISHDAAGNIFIAGTSDSQSATFGTQTVGFLFQSMFLAKYDASGNCAWVRKGGGYLKNGQTISGIVTINGLALDPTGKPIVVGGFLGSPQIDSVTLTNIDKTPFSNTQDILAAKFSTDGQAEWVHGFGGTNSEYASSLAIDKTGAIYLGVNFNTSTTISGIISSNKADAGAILLKLSAAGDPLWQKSLVQPLDTYPGYVRTLAIGAGDTLLVGFQTEMRTFSLGAFTIQNEVSSPSFDPVDMGLILKYDFTGTLLDVIRTPFNVDGRGTLNIGLAFFTDPAGNLFARSDAPVMTSSTGLGTPGLTILKYSPDLQPLWTNRISKMTSGSPINTGSTLQALGIDANGFLHVAATFSADRGTPLTIGWTNAFPFTAFGPQLVLFQIRPQFAPVAPTFVLQPTNFPFAPPIGFTNVAQASAWPAPGYVWYHNGKAAPGQTNYLLQLKSSSAADAGTYYVVASNSYGLATSVVVHAQSALGFDSPLPSSISVTAGGRLSITALASGTSEISYQWQHAGTNLPNATSATLVVNNADGSTAGDYRVTICNASGCLTSNPATTVQVLNPGSIDPSGTFTAVGKGISSLALESSGNILVANGSALLRVSPAGVVDTSFISPDPFVLHWSYFNESYGPKVVRVDPDGKIMVGGDFMQFLPNNTVSLPAPRIVRLNQNGSLDSSFNPGSGPTNSIDGPTYSRVNAIVRQPDGKYLVGGWFNKYNGTNAVNLVRLNSDGSLDGTFHLHSFQYTTSGGGGGSVHTIARQSDGKIVIGGEFATVDNKIVNGVARLNSDGSFDTGFPAAPLQAPPFARVEDVQILPNQQILVGGSFANTGNYYRGVFRLNTDGSQDLSFIGNVNSVNALLQLGDGKIVAGGQGAFARILADGTTDSAFVVANLVSQDTTFALLKDASGAILAGGSYGLVRLVTEQTPPPPPTFSPAQIFALPSGEIQFSICGEVGQSFTIEASTNLVNWTTFSQPTLDQGCATITDSRTNSPRRYYRIVNP